MCLPGSHLIPSVPREAIKNHLSICPHTCPVKKKVRKQALERQEFIAEEIKKLEATCMVRGVFHPTWLANPVVPQKDSEKRRLCIDFKDVNKLAAHQPDSGLNCWL